MAEIPKVVLTQLTVDELAEAVANKVIEKINQPEEELVETAVFDQENIYENCTVQVLTNTVTGETSVGWWRNDISNKGDLIP